MPRVVLIHHHIFKNAGTSFNSALKGYFGNAFLEYDLPNGQAVTREELAKVIEANPHTLAISSHHACMPTPQGENYQTISSVILRDPIERIKSIYNFEKKQDASTPGAQKAKELTFKDYILWRLESSPTAICNYQTHYCSRTQSCSAHYQSTEEDLNIALDNLNKAIIVGLVEEYPETLEVARSKLNKFYPNITLKNVHLNQTSSSKTSISPVQISLFLSKT